MVRNSSQNFLQKYTNKLAKNFKQQQKQHRFLKSQGFTPEQIRNVIESSND
ncbi:RecX family transcriptional regulator [Paraglaciecola arctica]|uniref:RecX family transcriptional regulator n=1 Tax=Paraglaciecola arctica TaxID=1128911 RepID=UPI001C0780E8|nr:RecX family transcriptional regulator [Paraglaciecola arctica]